MAARPFDLVLLDIQMPGMTGVEVLQQLRAADGPNRDAPVVALTADVTSGGRQRYLELGFTEHSPKPIQIAGADGLHHPRHGRAAAAAVDGRSGRLKLREVVQGRVEARAHQVDEVVAVEARGARRRTRPPGCR